MDKQLLFIRASQTAEIRRLFNWTQDDLAKKLGVSRPTIVNMEKDPSKVTQPLVLALLLICLIELEERIKGLEEIDFDLWNTKDSRGTLLKQLDPWGLSNKTISSFISSLTTLSGAFSSGSLVPMDADLLTEDLNSTDLTWMEVILAYSKLLSNDAASAAETSDLNTYQIERLAKASLIQLEVKIANSLGVEKDNTDPFARVFHKITGENLPKKPVVDGE